MKRYRWYLAGILVLAGAALVAAGTAGGAPKTQRVSGHLSIIAKWTADEQKSFMAVLAPFEKKNPGIKIKYTGAGDNVAQIVSTAVQGGNPPDLAQLPQPGLLRDFANRGALKPIAFARPLIAKNYAPVWLQLGSVKGKLYGLFFKGANKSTVWYNVHAFKSAGVKPPTTWPQFLSVAKTIHASGAEAYSIGGGDGWTLTDLFENLYLRQAGTAKYDQLTTHKIKWTDASVKTTLRTMAQVLSDSANIYGGTSGALQTDFPTSVSNVFSTSPKAAMVLEGDFVPGAVPPGTVTPLKDFNEFAFPSVNGSKPAVMGGGDVVIMFRDSPAAEALIKYLASPAAQTIWAKRGGYSSPNKGVKPSAYSDPLNRKTALALASAKIFRFDMSDLQPAAFGATVGQGEWKIFQDFLQNPSNVDGTASALEAAAAKVYKK
jgi:ABC-type glycerol-3-phosphate transport system substrate-binding protein